jgi:hypothetical protein
VVDACRYLGALFVAALQGAAPSQVLDGVCEPVPGLWAAKPLKADVLAMAERDASTPGGVPADTGNDAVAAIANVRSAVRAAATFEDAVRIAREQGGDGSLDGALAGALYGALCGAATIPAARLTALTGAAQVEQVFRRLRDRDEWAVK